MSGGSVDATGPRSPQRVARMKRKRISDAKWEDMHALGGSARFWLWIPLRSVQATPLASRNSAVSETGGQEPEPALDTTNRKPPNLFPMRG
jgi:hypothetical protein